MFLLQSGGKGIMNRLIHRNNITLDFYEHKYHSQLEDYGIPAEQLTYTSMPLDAVQKCSIEDDRFPTVILSNDRVVGFFVLHGWEGVKAYSDNRKAILLRGYSINDAFQGKGIATNSLIQLPSFIKTYFPEKNEIILAVNIRNKVAQYVYKKAGFKDKGRRVMGKKGELIILHIDVS